MRDFLTCDMFAAPRRDLPFVRRVVRNRKRQWGVYYRNSNGLELLAGTFAQREQAKQYALQLRRN